MSKVGKLAALGYTFERIVAETGCSPDYVARSLRRLGDGDMRGRRSLHVVGLMFTEPDATLSEIARMVGVSRQRVWTLYHKALEAGIPVPSRARSEP